jgi:hypothetical protein
LGSLAVLNSIRTSRLLLRLPTIWASHTNKQSSGASATTLRFSRRGLRQTAEPQSESLRWFSPGSEPYPMSLHASRALARRASAMSMTVFQGAIALGNLIIEGESSMRSDCRPCQNSSDARCDESFLTWRTPYFERPQCSLSPTNGKMLNRINRCRADAEAGRHQSLTGELGRAPCDQPSEESGPAVSAPRKKREAAVGRATEVSQVPC